MNLVQIIEALPPQVYVRRGELIIHFSDPADLVARLSETAGILASLDEADTGRAGDGRSPRGRRPRANGGELPATAVLMAPDRAEEQL